MGKIQLLSLCIFLICGIFGQLHAQRYLALGDSYTIGEGVSSQERFPMQVTLKILLETGAMEETKIIARTGWTTDELIKMIASENPQGPYDLVTLLIGVNNQYRGRELDSFKEEFEILLKQAINFAGGDKSKVFVLSIPDWGVSPFAVDRKVDQAKVAKEIDAYNEAKKAICMQWDVTFIDITTHYRKYGASEYVADRLHPNAVIYEYWANQIWERIKP